MKNRIIATAIMVTLSVSGCAGSGQQNEWGMGNKQTVGGLGGAVLGGLAGASMGKGGGRLWTTGAGVLVGALLGSEVGKSLDRADSMYNQDAWDRAYSAPLNETVAWSNPDNGHRGYVTPVREGRSVYDGSVCREYKQTIVVGGRAETAYGTACREPDGTWTLAN